MDELIKIYAHKHKDFYINVWRFLHLITFIYPSRDYENTFRNFFTKVSDQLPCKPCSDNWDTLHIKSINLDTTESLIQWLFDVHNEINASKQKEIKEYKEFMGEYSDPSLYKTFNDRFGICIDIHNIQREDFIQFAFERLSHVTKYP